MHNVSDVYCMLKSVSRYVCPARREIASRLSGRNDTRQTVYPILF